MKLGIVGGGQLARMTALAAIPLGIDVTMLAGERDEGVRGIFPVMDGDHDDRDALMRFGATVDVVTFDHELVPLDVVKALEDAGVVVRPGSAALAFADKITMRRTFFDAGIPVPCFDVVQDLAGVERFAEEHGWPVVLKAPHGGYDGRGVAVAADRTEANEFLAASAGRDVLIEEALDLQRELAVITVTAVDGDRVTYPPVVSVQEQGMCREVHAGTGLIPTELSRDAVHLANRVAAIVGAVGVLAVELFVVAGADGDDRLLVNEVAPRPHNSGHVTIDWCVTDQFENHTRAVLGLPLGPVDVLRPAASMVNVVGTDGTDPREQIGAAEPGTSIHLYAKTPRPGRKIGHVTTVGTTLAFVTERSRQVASVLEGRPLTEVVSND